MTRLPTINSDNSAWGSILNAFLGVGHNADGTLLIANGTSITAIDNNAVSSGILQINSSNYIELKAPASNIFQFTDNTGNPVAYINGNQGKFQLAATKFLSAADNSFVPATILGVDSSGNTLLYAHVTNNQVVICDSSGNPIATFAGTNKITALKGGQQVARTAVSNNYTILASDYLVAYTSTSSAFVATLPAAAAGNAGQEWVIKDESGGAATHNITVKTAGGNIDGVSGSTGLVINTNYGVLRVYSNGTNYFTR
jgi:hypothetical protein